MKGKIKIYIIVGILIVIGGISFSLYKNKSVNDTRGGVIENKKEIVYEVKNNYKDLEIKIKTEYNKRKNIKIIIIDPNKNEKVIDTKTNKEISKNFKGEKGNWTVSLETDSQEPIDFEINFILKNK